MNHSQKKYLSVRIKEILEKKINKLRNGLTVELSNYEKYKLIKDGKVPLLPFLNDRYSFEAKFDFSKYEKNAKDVPGYEAKIEALRVRAQQIEDEVFIGDCTKAMELLKSFEKE